MASPLTPPTSPEPHWFRWQPLSPLVAAATLWFLSRVWHHHFSWPVWIAVVLSAWAGALVAASSQSEPPESSRQPLLLAAALALIGSLVALRWLPRGLVVSSVPVVGLAVFQALMSLGNRNPWARRLALACAALGAVGVLAIAPFNWPVGLRLGMIALAVAFSWSMWKGGEKMLITEAPLVLARGLIFAAGVLLPVAWWTPAGLIGEMARPENGVFALLAIVATACRLEWRKRTPSHSRLTGYAAVSLILTGVSGLGAWASPPGPVRGMLFGVGAVSLLLGAGVGPGIRSFLPPVWRRLVPDLSWVGLVLVGFGRWPLL